jgi:hypothetical protein
MTISLKNNEKKLNENDFHYYFVKW